jgi:GGDEF domain-containing protein
LLLWLIAALGLAVCVSARPARAAAFAPGSTCHAAAAADESSDRLAAQPARWQCDGDGWAITAPVAYLRFDLRGRTASPDLFTTRMTRFGALRLTMIAADGSRVHRDLTEADMTPATDDWVMRAALPRTRAPAQAIVVRIAGARHAGMLSDARVSQSRPPTAGEWRDELLVAGLCGMLCVPLLLNFAFFRVLRERFLTWHAATAVCMLAQTLLISGLINRFAALSLATLCNLSAITWGVGIAAAALFSADFIEPGKLDPLHRRLLRAVTPWIAAVTAFYLLADGDLRPLAQPVYFASLLPILALFAWVMAVAARRGSRAVRFQIVAWLPIMLTGLARIVSTLGATAAPLELSIEQHVSLAFEVIVTTLAVADRFLMIRRQRDVAMAEMRIIEERSERDHLTGLYNRRAVEQRFAKMHAAGFHAMALIDLDRFKQVNDTFGHLTGDAVLRAAAEALDPDGDTVAVRIGGEEFMLLLRGPAAADRAERRRRPR